MIEDKIIVCVTASFEDKRQLLKTLKKYARQTDERFACWDEFAFTTEILPECDALLVFNTPGDNIQTTCYPGNVIAFMMEPGVPAEHPWMYKALHQYAQVYSPMSQSENTILSHGFLGWYFNQDYNYLKALDCPVKTRSISCIASDLNQLEGHRRRLHFIKILQDELPQIDFFGKGSNFLPDKMDGLLPYRYSVAIENTSQPHYFTEKINDCFLSYTVPIYYGCTNIGQYFPGNSYIPIDIENPGEAIRKIKLLLKDDDWEKRLEALKEARELVLEKYQPLAGAARILRELQPFAGKKETTLKPVYPDLLNRIKMSLYKLVNR